MWINKLPFTVSKTTYFFVEVFLVCLVGLVTILGTHYFGVFCGLLICIFCAPLLPIRALIIRVPEHVSLTQEEYNSLEHKNEDTLYVIRKKKPEE